jgi:hypothetical protein
MEDPLARDDTAYAREELTLCRQIVIFILISISNIVFSNQSASPLALRLSATLLG